MKKNIVLIALSLLLVCSCGKNHTAVINCTIDSLKDSSVVLQKLNFKYLRTVDTISTDSNGKFRYKVKLSDGNPAFYYLYSGSNQLVSMILLPGDKVTISVAADGIYQIEGSEESLNLKAANEEFEAARSQMNELADSYLLSTDKAEQKRISAKMSRLYVDYKRAAIRRAMNNSHSISSATIMFQKFSDELPVFAEATDGIIFKSIYDSLYVDYPKSEYLVALLDEINVRQNNMDLNAKFNSIEAVSFPELSMPDVNGVTQVLSKLEGKVIILSFWSSTQNTHKMFNNDLMDIYGKYHSKGLEIYQVSLDIDKSAWGAAVKGQNLPWISVNDGMGTNSQAVISYNLKQVPSMFVISRDGSIIARDVFDKTKLDNLVKKSL